MERTKYFIVLLLLMIFSMVLSASRKAEIYQSFISSDMDDWKLTIDEMQKQDKKGENFYWELVNYQYGYIAWCLGNDREEEAEKYLTLAERNIVTLEKVSADLSMINVYKTAFYGYRIGLDLWKAPLIGGKSMETAKLAIKHNPENPHGYIQLGNIEYYMPAVFGGSKSQALKYYMEAMQLMERDPAAITNDWNYLGLMVTIANANFDMKQYPSARKYYEKILAIEPRFEWVRDELYPELLNTMNREKHE